MTKETQILEHGKEELNKLHFSTAEKDFQSALRVNPRSVDAAIGLARIRMLKNETKEAERLVDEALKVDPQNAHALVLKGVASMQKNDWKKSVFYFDKARYADPNLEASYTNLARSYRKLGDFKAAEEAARKAIQLNPESYQAHAEMSIVCIKTNRMKAGIEEMIEAIRINPLFLRGYVMLGRLYQLAGKINLSIALYQKGLKHNPLAFRLREELAGAFAFLGDFQKAYRQAVLIALHRGKDSDWVRVGNCALATGQFEKAEKAFEKALQANPANWEAYYNLGELYFAAKLYKKAKEKYLTAIEKDGKSYKPLNGIGLLLLMSERNCVEAEKYFLRALELAPQQKEPLLNMALALAGRKAYAEAEKFARAALQSSTKGDRIFEQAEQLISWIRSQKQ